MFALVLLCGPIGLGLTHCGIMKSIQKNGCVGFSLSCMLCCVGAALNRKALRDNYHLKGNCIKDCFLYICCPCCLITQEYRKMKREAKKENHIPLANNA